MTRGTRSWISSGAGRRRPRSAPGGSSSGSTSRPASSTTGERYGKVNEHNGWVPRDFWLEEWEKQAIVGFHLNNPLEGYRRLTFMMLDDDVVAVSQSGLLSKWNGKPSKKGTGFAQPLAAHQHWHIDVSYLNIGGTFYYLCSILDGYSRYIVNWDLRESMTEADIEIILQRAREKD